MISIDLIKSLLVCKLIENLSFSFFKSSLCELSFEAGLLMSKNSFKALRAKCAEIMFILYVEFKDALKPPCVSEAIVVRESMIIQRTFSPPPKSKQFG